MMSASLSIPVPAGLASGTMGWIGYVSFSHFRFGSLEDRNAGIVVFQESEKN